MVTLPEMDGLLNQFVRGAHVFKTFNIFVGFGVKKKEKGGGGGSPENKSAHASTHGPSVPAMEIFFKFQKAFSSYRGG
jgi:hypothetical protein